MRFNPHTRNLLTSSVPVRPLFLRTEWLGFRRWSNEDLLVARCVPSGKPESYLAIISTMRGTLSFSQKCLFLNSPSD